MPGKAKKAAAPAPVPKWAPPESDEEDEDVADASEPDVEESEPDTKSGAEESGAEEVASPAAAAADDMAGGWTTITDDRKEKAVARRARKAEEAKRELLSRVDVLTTDVALQAALAKADVLAAELTGAAGQAARIAKGPQKTARKQKKGNPNRTVISSEPQLLTIVTGLVENVPAGRHLAVSAVGDRIQDMTGHAWNKKFKPVYGTLPDFFKRHSDTFHVTKDMKVMLKSEHEVIKAYADPLGGAAKKKKAAAAPAGGETKTVSKKGESAVRRAAAAAEAEAESSSPARYLFVFVLVVAVLIGTFLAVEGITLSQLVDRIKSKF